MEINENHTDYNIRSCSPNNRHFGFILFAYCFHSTLYNILYKRSKCEIQTLCKHNTNNIINALSANRRDQHHLNAMNVIVCRKIEQNVYHLSCSVHFVPCKYEVGWLTWHHSFMIIDYYYYSSVLWNSKCIEDKAKHFPLNRNTLKQMAYNRCFHQKENEYLLLETWNASNQEYEYG